MKNVSTTYSLKYYPKASDRGIIEQAIREI